MKWQIKSSQPWILYPYSVLTVQTIVFLHSTVIQILGNRVLKCCQKQFNCPSWWIAIEYHGLPLPKWLERERERSIWAKSSVWLDWESEGMYFSLYKRNDEICQHAWMHIELYIQICIRTCLKWTTYINAYKCKQANDKKLL